MTQERFSLGVEVFHVKYQIIGTIRRIENGLAHVRVSKTIPLQVWKKEDLKVWDSRTEIQRMLKEFGYIGGVY